MYKLIGVAILGVVIGALAGFLVARGQRAAFDVERRSLAAEIQGLKLQVDSQAETLAKSSAEAARHAKELLLLRSDLESKNTQIAQSNAAAQELAAESSLRDAASSLRKDPAPRLKKADKDKLQSRASDLSETASRLREGLQSYMDNEISKAQDPVAAQRMSSLNESMQQQMDLVQQLRDAKTDAERDAVRQNLTELRNTTRGLVQDQQDAMLRQLATQYGVTAPDKQEQFMQAYRDMQNSPFFRMGAGFLTPTPASKP